MAPVRTTPAPTWVPSCQFLPLGRSEWQACPGLDDSSLLDLYRYECDTTQPPTQAPTQAPGCQSLTIDENRCASVAHYVDNEYCSFEMPPVPLHVVSFNTEATFDKLTV